MSVDVERPAFIGQERFEFRAVRVDSEDQGIAMIMKGIQENGHRVIAAGGYLFAEDWCMEDFVEKAWSTLVGAKKIFLR